MIRQLAMSAALIASIPALAVAGEKLDAEVQINTTSRWARGSLGSARNSTDSEQQIGCYLSSYNNSNTNVGLCWAIDENGAVGSCSFYENPRFAAIVSSMTDSSHITFNWDESYRCTRITVSNFSTYEPRK